MHFQKGGLSVKSEFLLELKDISKNFSGVYALKNVSMNIGYGEIHALMGENGAGNPRF